MVLVSVNYVPRSAEQLEQLLLTIFFGQAGDISRIPFDDTGSVYPSWDFTIEDDTEWSIGTTVKVTVSFDDGCPSACTKPAGSYFVKVITPNGVTSQHYFGT